MITLDILQMTALFEIILVIGRDLGERLIPAGIFSANDIVKEIGNGSF